MSTLQIAGMQVAATSCLLWIRVRGIKITFSKSSKNLEKTGSKVHQPEVQAGTVIHNLWVIGWGDPSSWHRKLTQLEWGGELGISIVYRANKNILIPYIK